MKKIFLTTLFFVLLSYSVIADTVLIDEQLSGTPSSLWFDKTNTWAGGINITHDIGINDVLTIQLFRGDSVQGNMDDNYLIFNIHEDNGGEPSTIIATNRSVAGSEFSNAVGDTANWSFSGFTANKGMYWMTTQDPEGLSGDVFQMSYFSSGGHYEDSTWVLSNNGTGSWIDNSATGEYKFRAWIEEVFIDIIPPNISMISPSITNDSIYNYNLNWNVTCVDDIETKNLSVNIFSTISIYNVSDNLISYYRFEEGVGIIAIDDLNNFNGTHNANYELNNAPNNTGSYGLSFNGAESLDTGIDLSNLEHITISGWFYRNSTSYRFDIAQANNDNVNRFKFIRHSNGFIYSIIDSNYGTYSDNGVGWSHITMVYDGTQTGNSNRLKMYLNGVEKILSFSGTIGTSLSTISDNLLKLGYDDGSSFYSTGIIDNVAIFNVSLSSDKVLEIYTKDRINYEDTIIGGDNLSYNNITNISSFSVGKYYTSIKCYDTSLNLVSKQNSFLIDQTVPISIYTFPSNIGISSVIVNESFNFNWSFIDENLLWNVNVSCTDYDFSINNIGNSNYHFNESHTYNTTGIKNCNIKYCDAHTKNKIKDYKIIKDLEHDSIIFNNISIRSYNSKIKEMSYSKFIDKYSFCFTPETYKNEFIIELPKKCIPVTNSNYNSHYVCDNKYWVDFEGQDVYSINNLIYVDTSKQKKAIIPKPICFNSIGSLNCVSDLLYINVEEYPILLNVNIINPDNFESFISSYIDIEINFTSKNESGECSIYDKNKLIRNIYIPTGFYNFTNILLKRQNNVYKVCCNNESTTQCDSIIIQHELTLSQQIGLFLMLCILIGLIIFGEMTNSFAVRLISSVFSLILTYEWFENSSLFTIFIIISVFLFLRAGAKMFSSGAE